MIAVATAVTAAVVTLPGCNSPPAEYHPPEPTYPRLAATPEMKPVVLDRLEHEPREPYLTLLSRVQNQAAGDFRQDEPGQWTHEIQGHNANITLANAFLAWVFDDPVAADKARQGLAAINTEFAHNTVWDVNIRMVRPLHGWTLAWDLLQATPWYPAAEAEAAEDRITEVCDAFYEEYVDDDVVRTLMLSTTQNNHPIRTATGIGMVALAFPDHPRAPQWANWAFSELDYLWGPTGQYVQPDGGISEGPFYGLFAWAPSLALFIAADNAWRRSAGTAPPELKRDCRNRTEVDPWTGHGCVEGELFVWENPLHGDTRFRRAADWELALRLPGGLRPPLADANFFSSNGSALLTSFGGGGAYRWDWETNRFHPLRTNRAANLLIHHLLYLDDAVAAREPTFRSRILPDAGNAVLRSGWNDDARWLLLVAEHGAARKTVHDHVDGTSFSLAAYGEYLLLDPGYHKPDPQKNAKTSAGPAHNLILIDGKAAPRKGLLTNFGDADAFLRHPVIGEGVHYVEAHQEYQQARIERSVAMVDGRYFVVSDHVAPAAGLNGAREHRFRLNGYAGYDEGGIFELRSDGALWERPLAGVEVFIGATVSADATAEATSLACVEPPFVEDEPPHVHKFDLDRTVAHHGVMDAVIHAPAPGFLTVLAPYRAGDAPGTTHGPLEVRDLRPAGPGGVAAWQIAGPLFTDVAVQRADDAPTRFTLSDGTEVETDARLFLIRSRGDGGFALLVRGTFLVVDGEDRLARVTDPVSLSEP